MKEYKEIFPMKEYKEESKLSSIVGIKGTYMTRNR